MKKIITILFLFMAVIANASDYYKSKIQFVNGDIKEGYAELPSNKERTISYRETEDGKTQRYNFKLIDKITYYKNSGNEVIFIRTNLRGVYKTKKGIQENVKKKKDWYLEVFSSDYISMYYMGDSYHIDKNDNVILKSASSGIGTSFFFLSFKRPDEKPVTRIAIDTGLRFMVSEKSYLDNVIVYFDDVPELVQRIENNEFRGGSFKQIVEAYTKYKKKSTETGALQE